MAGFRPMSAAGRALLVAGAVVLFASLFLLPWFRVSGTRPDLPAGSYDGLQSTERVNALLGGPWGWIAFVLLSISAFLGLGVAAIGRKTRRVGALGMLVLLVYGLVIVVVPTSLNPQGSNGTASVDIANGFVAALLGAALMEAGARWPRAVRGRYVVPTTAE